MAETGDAPGAAPPPRVMPWDLHPSLTAERLQVCARLLANARRDAIAMASHELGDDPWSIGCRAYAFSRHRLRRTAEAGHYPWLSVLDESHHFVFLIDEVPVRFYRGPAEEPTDRTLRCQEVEARQLSLALGRQAEEDGLLFRFAVETGEGGRVERVVFLALRGEERTECFWPVPLEVAPPQAAPGAAVQLRLIADDGYEGPTIGRNTGGALPPPRPRRAGGVRPARPAPATGLF
ncbi:hypothetical protein [Crenalkalicoccus roseus]|uniref:hypothetical protein n=1 Tax=Crenalkalicoccus roseus TaxID=1485588 RepID=UPI0010812A1F|nr:hypothetical protein [Crenalkalicoccus roseus]